MLSAEDVELAEALRLYLTPRYPLEDADAVTIRFGRERGGALLAQVREIVREAGAWPTDWERESMSKAVKRVRREFRERWPMLDRDAIDALVSWWVYVWK